MVHPQRPCSLAPSIQAQAATRPVCVFALPLALNLPTEICAALHPTYSIPTPCTDNPIRMKQMSDRVSTTSPQRMNLSHPCATTRGTPPISRPRFYRFRETHRQRCIVGEGHLVLQLRCAAGLIGGVVSTLANFVTCMVELMVPIPQGVHNAVDCPSWVGQQAGLSREFG